MLWLFSDVDHDNSLGKGDLEKTLCALTGGELNEEEITFVVDKVTTLLNL